MLWGEKERILRSLSSGTGTFIAASVVYKLFWGYNDWLFYAILDGMVVMVASFCIYCIMLQWKNIIVASIMTFFIAAFVLGVVMSVTSWGTICCHITIMTILTLIEDFWENS